MEEKCKNCTYCKELYTPPTMKTEAKYELCCVLFILEDRVMYLSDGESMCECFKEKAVQNER